MASRRVERFTLRERVVHWLAALSFVYAALSGLAFFSQHLYWLAGVMGGGTAARWAHPWAGVVFGVALGAMSLRWARSMRLDSQDVEWLKGARKYAAHEEEGLPEAGRFNGGQKMLFWTESLCCLLLVASGVALWFPEQTPRALRLAAVLVHPVAAIVAISGIIVHIYMGTLGVPGALRSMTRGWATEGWAARHHPKWLREISKR
jgi:formate dehydrogenase subunit gamma